MRGIWSPQFGIEQDTIIYVVTKSEIYYGYPYNWNPRYREFWADEIDEDAPEPEPFIRRRCVIRDTTLAVGPLRGIDVIEYWENRPSWAEPTLLQEMEFWTLDVAHFAPELGVVVYEYVTYPRYDSIAKYSKSELVAYFNPQKTVKAEQARRDFRHVLRHELE